jgi:hypothetical protein
MCAARPLIDRLVPAPKSEGDRVRAFAGRLLPGGISGPARGVAGFGLAAIAIVVVGAGIVAAGAPARGVVAPVSSEALTRPPTAIDPATLPAITVGDDVLSFDHTLDATGMASVVVTLGQNLELENQALIRRDSTLLPAIDHGDRLDEMQERLADAQDSGLTLIDHYNFDSIDARLLIPFGKQTGLSLGLDGRGTVIRETYSSSGTLLEREEAPFAQTFAVRRATGDRWLNVGVFPIGSK